jgi:hypothetical protein
MAETSEDAKERTQASDLAIEFLRSEQEDEAAGPRRYELFTYPADFTLEVLYQKWKSDEIAIPNMQRRFVWKQAQASRLIESFLLGLPVPPIFFYAERGSERLLVVDGQQRLKSVFYFLEGLFGEEVAGKRATFRLVLGGIGKWDGKTFGELEPEDSRRLRNSVLRSFIMKQVDPQDDTSIHHVFERLNTGGTLLTNQEVRNCIFDGPFNDFLFAANKLAAWRSILGRDTPDSRLKDLELILRFLALANQLDAYEKPMKDFLSGFMRRNRSGMRVPDFKALFESVASLVAEGLGTKPFHLRAGLNAAVFDSVFVAFARHTDAPIGPQLRKRYQALVEDPEYQKVTSTGTTDISSIKRRISLAEERLFGNS